MASVNSQDTNLNSAINSNRLPPMSNMQQLVSHLSTLLPVRQNKKRSRTNEQTQVSEFSTSTGQTKRRILKRP
jgi:hypothetical protein